MKAAFRTGFAVTLLLSGWAPAPAARSEDPPPPEPVRRAGESVYPMAAELARAQELVARYKHLEALAVLREIIRKHDDHAPARFLAASALMQMRRYEAARTLLEGILRTHPMDPGALNNLAWMYATAEDPSFRNPARAIELARGALLARPDDFHVWSTLAEAHFIGREYERAARAAREALSLARASGAPAAQLLSYEEQYRKCTEALQAFSIID